MYISEVVDILQIHGAAPITILAGYGECEHRQVGNILVLNTVTRIVNLSSHLCIGRNSFSFILGEREYVTGREYLISKVGGLKYFNVFSCLFLPIRIFLSRPALPNMVH